MTETVEELKQQFQEAQAANDPETATKLAKKIEAAGKPKRKASKKPAAKKPVSKKGGSKK